MLFFSMSDGKLSLETPTSEIAYAMRQQERSDEELNRIVEKLKV
jgi:hypothetical protein